MDDRREPSRTASSWSTSCAPARLPVLALAGHRVLAVGERAERARPPRPTPGRRPAPYGTRPTPVPHPRDGWRRSAGALRAGRDGPDRGRAGYPLCAGSPSTAPSSTSAARERSALPSSTMRSPTWSEARTGLLASSCAIRRAVRASRSGSTRATAICSSSPATAPGRAAPEHRGRADDLPAECLSHRGGSDPPGARRERHERLGHCPLTFGSDG